MGTGASSPNRARQALIISALFSTRPADCDMRLIIAATGSPGTMRGMAKMIVEPSHIVRTHMPSRRITYCRVNPRTPRSYFTSSLRTTKDPLPW